jgi:uncharacterized membrane protein (DUF485 family)
VSVQHEPSAVHGVDRAAKYKERLGLKMLAVYGSLYALFIIVNVVWPSAMGWIVVAGLNLAVVWGFALIVIALILALIYNHACTKREKSHENEKQVDDG